MLYFYYVRNKDIEYILLHNSSFRIKFIKINCISLEHRHEIDVFYSYICEVLHCSSQNSIPSSKSSDCRNYIVPGFNDYVKDLYNVARSDYVV